MIDKFGRQIRHNQDGARNANILRDDHRGNYGRASSQQWVSNLAPASGPPAPPPGGLPPSYQFWPSQQQQQPLYFDEPMVNGGYHQQLPRSNQDQYYYQAGQNGNHRYYPAPNEGRNVQQPPQIPGMMPPAGPGHYVDAAGYYNRYGRRDTTATNGKDYGHRQSAPPPDQQHRYPSYSEDYYNNQYRPDHQSVSNRNNGSINNEPYSIEPNHRYSLPPSTDGYQCNGYQCNGYPPCSRTECRKCRIQFKQKEPLLNERQQQLPTYDHKAAVINSKNNNKNHDRNLDGDFSKRIIKRARNEPVVIAPECAEAFRANYLKNMAVAEANRHFTLDRKCEWAKLEY